MKKLAVFALIAVLTACGHSQIKYTPEPPASMTRQRAIAIVERGFHEDYGHAKPQAVLITEEAIILSDGSITTGSRFGSAIPTGYGGAIVAGNSREKTIAAGQHIYFDTLQPSMVMERNGRDNQFAVIIRTEPGITSRHVFFRFEARAKEFADALEYLRRRREVTDQ